MYQDIAKNYKSLIISALPSKGGINKWRKRFIVEIISLFLSINGRINFLQLGRYGEFGEQRYRQQFEKKLCFMEINKHLVLEHGSGHFAIGLDPSFITKSGKSTFGCGKYWSGCAQTAKWGLEITGLAAIDIDNHTAFHLEAVQTPDRVTLDNMSFNLLNWYAQIITDRAETLMPISKYIVADAYFSKCPFVDSVIQAGMHLVSRLRDDANLRYLYKGEATGKQGRPKQYDGKIYFKNIDFDYFEVIEKNEEFTLLCAEVNSVALKRNIKLVIRLDKNNKHKLFFSTDVKQDGLIVYSIYTKRFQIEFLYRDGKQYTGLNDCQARSENKLNFHFNASLTSINIAKISHWISIDKEDRESFSMADIKTVNHNIVMLEKFFQMFAIDADSIKNKEELKELIYFGKIAA